MNPLFLVAAFLLGRRTAGPQPGWPGTSSPPPKHPPVLIHKGGVTPLPGPSSDASAHMGPPQVVTADAHKAAAQALSEYLHGAAPDWGFPGKPSATVQRLQLAMGGVQADGIYGPKTQARCTALGFPCPPRPNVKQQAKQQALKKVSKLIPRIP